MDEAITERKPPWTKPSNTTANVASKTTPTEARSYSVLPPTIAMRINWPTYKTAIAASN